MLSEIHSGHQGVNKCVQRASQCVWWPRITKDIQVVVQNCSFCQEHKPDQRSEPMIATPLPSIPWDKIGADLCDFKGKKYLVVIDYYSRFIEICELSVSNSAAVIGKLKGIMVRFGLCSEFVSDNGPPFNSAEFAKFAKEYKFKHTFSSPYFPISNGEAERAVQTAKKILSTDDPYIALLAYRSTTHSSTGFSPAELCMGRKIRTTLPVLSENLLPVVPDLKVVKSNDYDAKLKYKHYYDKRHGVRNLPELADNDVVRIKLPGQKIWGEPGVVMNKCGSRSYTVSHGSSVFRRNRKHLQFVPSPTSEPSVETDNRSDEPMPMDTQQPEVKPNPEPPDVSVSNDNSVKYSSFGRKIKPVAKLNL